MVVLLLTNWWRVGLDHKTERGTNYTKQQPMLVPYTYVEEPGKRTNTMPYFFEHDPNGPERWWTNWQPVVEHHEEHREPLTNGLFRLTVVDATWQPVMGDSLFEGGTNSWKQKLSSTTTVTIEEPLEFTNRALFRVETNKAVAVGPVQWRKEQPAPVPYPPSPLPGTPGRQ